MRVVLRAITVLAVCVLVSTACSTQRGLDSSQEQDPFDQENHLGPDLSMYLVDAELTAQLIDIQRSQPGVSYESLAEHVPPDRTVLPYVKVLQSGNTELVRFIVAYSDLKTNGFSAGEFVRVAPVRERPPFGYYVEVELSDSGRAKLAELSRSHIGESLAIVVHGEVISPALLIEPLNTRVLTLGDLDQAIPQLIRSAFPEALRYD